jgi:hypothetical protein
MRRRFQFSLKALLGKLLVVTPLMFVAVTCVEHLAGRGQPWLGMRGRVECVLFPILFGAVNGIVLGSWRKAVLLYLFAAMASVSFAMQLK